MKKTIFENGIRVYLNEFCEHCGERIPWKKTHKITGIIPRFIQGHNTIGKPRSKETKDKISKSKFGNKDRWIDGYGSERSSATQRNLGFIPLNSKTEIANEQHHLDNMFVLFVPRKLHEGFKHSVKTGKNLEEMNNLVWKWFDEEGYKSFLNGL